MLSLHTLDYSSAMETNGAVTCATTQMNPVIFIDTRFYAYKVHGPTLAMIAVIVKF